MPTYKFRVGDKVRIARVIGIPGREQQLNKYIGKEGTIASRRECKGRWYNNWGGPRPVAYFVTDISFGTEQVPWFRQDELEIAGD